MASTEASTSPVPSHVASGGNVPPAPVPGPPHYYEGGHHHGSYPGHHAMPPPPPSQSPTQMAASNLGQSHPQVIRGFSIFQMISKIIRKITK